MKTKDRHNLEIMIISLSNKKRKRGKKDKNDGFFQLLSLCPDESRVDVLKFRTPVARQTVQTQIRLHLKKQSDLGLRCLLLKLTSPDLVTYIYHCVESKTSEFSNIYRHDHMLYGFHP